MTLPSSLRYAALSSALLLATACGSSIAGQDGQQAGGGGAAQGGQSSGAAGHGGDPGGFGGFDGQGGISQIPWDHTCNDTGVSIAAFGASLDEACPDDYWTALHHDGAVAYDTHAGFVGHLAFHACANSGAQQIHFRAMLDGAGSVSLIAGRYVEDAQIFELVSGDLDITVDGDVGEVVVGTYSGLFGPQGGGGEPLQLQGDVRACHLPDQNLP